MYGQPARPRDVATAVEAIAGLWGIPSTEAGSTILGNFDSLVSAQSRAANILLAHESLM